MCKHQYNEKTMSFSLKNGGLKLMNIQPIETMINLIIENLHLLGYTVISMDDAHVVIKDQNKVLSIPTDNIKSFLHLQLCFLKKNIEELAK